MAADVTPERLLNPDREPHNWLMNDRTYDGQRFSPLARINKDNVKNLKLAYAVPLGGGAGNEFTNATPLAEDGFLYVTDSWNVLYKIDARSGDLGRIVWRKAPLHLGLGEVLVPRVDRLELRSINGHACRAQQIELAA
jgi:alcohol dehydrogenase (cytochrome c)